MIKDKCKLFLINNPELFRCIQYIYCMFLKPERLLCKKNLGNQNANKKILIIKPFSEDGIQGLMSLFAQTMRWVDYANRNSYEAYVDFKNYNTQYFVEGKNVWEFFFTQPSKLQEQEVYSSENVIISGATWKKTINVDLYTKKIFYDKNLCKQCHRIIWDNIHLSEEVKHIVARENKLIDVEKCIGVFIRGTDYTRLKPVGEYVQPCIDDVMEIIDRFLLKYGKLNLFLVTEDEFYYQKLKQKYRESLCVVSYDNFISAQQVDDFLSKSNVLSEDKKKRGQDYLAKIILLSKCRYLISSIAMGSITAYCFNGKKYEDEYIFDLGIYK